MLAALPFDDEDDAIRLANGTVSGLVAGLWTRDGARQMRVARRLRCGQVFVNNDGAGGGIELPFGGVKSSGYGREKGFEALFGFTTLNVVNNAGTTHRNKPLLEVTEAEFDRVYAVNVKSLYDKQKLPVARMRHRRSNL